MILDQTTTLTKDHGWQTEVILVDQEGEFGDIALDASMSEVIASLEAVRATIPVEFRDGAFCRFVGKHNWDDTPNPGVVIGYRRVAFAGEIEAEEIKNRAWEERERQRKIAEFEFLKRELGK